MLLMVCASGEVSLSPPLKILSERASSGEAMVLLVGPKVPSSLRWVMILSLAMATSAYP